MHSLEGSGMAIDSRVAAISICPNVLPRPSQPARNNESNCGMFDLFSSPQILTDVPCPATSPGVIKPAHLHVSYEQSRSLFAACCDVHHLCLKFCEQFLTVHEPQNSHNPARAPACATGMQTGTRCPGAWRSLRHTGAKLSASGQCRHK